MGRIYNFFREFYDEVRERFRRSDVEMITTGPVEGAVNGELSSFPEDFGEAVYGIHNGRVSLRNRDDSNIIFRSCAGWVFVCGSSKEDL